MARQCEVVFCGANLEKISCPHCGAECAPGWWGEAVSQRYDEGFTTLMVTVPCCGTEASQHADLTESSQYSNRRS